LPDKPKTIAMECWLEEPVVSDSVCQHRRCKSLLPSGLVIRYYRIAVRIKLLLIERVSPGH
jgi:hypothetical protein